MGKGGQSDGALPEWVPKAVQHYLAHTEAGEPIRALARQAQVHASTILRQVRRTEGRRDDPLVDGAIKRLSGLIGSPAQGERKVAMTRVGAGLTGPDEWGEARLAREARRLLVRLSAPGTVLAVARDMDMGVIVSDIAGGEMKREAVVERTLAEALALREWITCDAPGARIARYRLTPLGRAALRDLAGETRGGAIGFAEASARFGPQPETAQDEQDNRLRHMRSALAESPLSGLARRRDKDGKAFLPRDLVVAGEQMREDYELSRAGPALNAAWQRHVDAGSEGSFAPDLADLGDLGDPGVEAARERLLSALAGLGPGLADVALRCCCFLEGMEELERRMGWSARSGKIVLRIALQRLRRHYEDTQGRYAPMIG